MKMDEPVVRSACAWNSKIAKRRRPQELVIRHKQVDLLPHDVIHSVLRCASNGMQARIESTRRSTAAWTLKLRLAYLTIRK